MAWRIHEHVQRGEIDNRQPGIVCGRLWLDGFPEAIVLDLKGNACRDLAGSLLEFEHCGPTVPLRSEVPFAIHQVGTAGDLTASRKVRAPDVSLRQFLRLSRQGLRPPEHTANCLYLEWFSEANGRVVIESTEFKLTVSSPVWTLSAAQEQQRRRQASLGFSGFLHKLSDVIEATRVEPPEDRELDEFDYEKLLREGEARTDKFMELLDKYWDHPNREELVAREMGWEADGPDNSDEGPFPGDFQENRTLDRSPQLPNCPDAFGAPDAFEPVLDDPDLPPLMPDPRTEGTDWVRTGNGEVRHPLFVRSLNSSSALRKKCARLRLPLSRDADLWKLLSEFQVTSAKIGGALNFLAFGRQLREAPLTVACLKRALGHLHAAQAALVRVTAKSILPPGTLAFARRELFAIREEILRLMHEFRKRK